MTKTKFIPSAKAKAAKAKAKVITKSPPPCALCNPTIKWPYLLKTATKLGI